MCGVDGLRLSVVPAEDAPRYMSPSARLPRRYRWTAAVAPGGVGRHGEGHESAVYPVEVEVVAVDVTTDLSSLTISLGSGYSD